jgi:hypothetical protein
VVPWVPWLPVLALSGLFAWAISDLQPDFPSRQLYLRAGFLLVGLGLGFAFDDSAAPTTDPTPSPLHRRRLIRLGVFLLPWSAALGVLLWGAAQGGLDPVWTTSVEPREPELPVGRLVLEAATIASWCLAIASVVAKRWDDEPGMIASAALLALYAGSWMTPERWKPWAYPTAERWTTALPWWWLAFALGVLVMLSFSWDSRRQGLMRRMTGFLAGSEASNRPQQSEETSTTTPSR